MCWWIGLNEWTGFWVKDHVCCYVGFQFYTEIKSFVDVLLSFGFNMSNDFCEEMVCIYIPSRVRRGRDGNWIYNYICNQFLSPLTLWVRIPLRRRVVDTTLGDKVCQWLAAGRWFSPGTPDFSTNKTDRHDITEILLKVA